MPPAQALAELCARAQHLRPQAVVTRSTRGHAPARGLAQPWAPSGLLCCSIRSCTTRSCLQRRYSLSAQRSLLFASLGPALPALRAHRTICRAALDEGKAVEEDKAGSDPATSGSSALGLTASEYCHQSQVSLHQSVNVQSYPALAHWVLVRSLCPK
jgi:hypothetical protein